MKNRLSKAAPDIIILVNGIETSKLDRELKLRAEARFKSLKKLPKLFIRVGSLIISLYSYPSTNAITKSVNNSTKIILELMVTSWYFLELSKFASGC